MWCSDPKTLVRAVCTACLLSTAVTASCGVDRRTRSGRAARGGAGLKDRVLGEHRLRFRFEYSFQVRNVPAHARTARVWVPAPCLDAVQAAELEQIEAPFPPQPHSDAATGNRYIYFDGSADIQPLTWRLAWLVERNQIDGSQRSAAPIGEPEHHLLADSLIPLDGAIGDLALQLGERRESTNSRAHRIYELVRRRMTYARHGTGWGGCDADWACRSKYGDCTDYHSVFIGISRASRIPALFEMGFSLGYERRAGPVSGYHCWAKYHDPESGWWPVDISEADRRAELTDYYFGNLTARRVHFTTGRDLVLVPPQSGPPLNFFIYPYVEIDGKVDHDVERQFAYDSLTVVR